MIDHYNVVWLSSRSYLSEENKKDLMVAFILSKKMFSVRKIYDGKSPSLSKTPMFIKRKWDIEVYKKIKYWMEGHILRIGFPRENFEIGKIKSFIKRIKTNTPSPNYSLPIYVPKKKNIYVLSTNFNKKKSLFKWKFTTRMHKKLLPLN